MSAWKPLYDGYLADPFALRVDGTFYVFGTNPSGADPVACVRSDDGQHWTPVQGVLRPPDVGLGTDFWAPEVIHFDGFWWMHYSVGHAEHGHHIRVAKADQVEGPYRDQGVNLTPGELFAIDPHVFVDAQSSPWLFFTRDVLGHSRPGSHIAVAPMQSMTSLEGPATTIVSPVDDTSIYQRNRLMYSQRFDWHTIEGASVLQRGDALFMTYSRGNWTNESYGIAYATASHPTGVWKQASTPLLTTDDGLRGPGHNSLLVHHGQTRMYFHAWNQDHTKRQLHLANITWDGDTPLVSSSPASASTSPTASF